MTATSKIWNELTSILSNLNNFHSLEVVDRVVDSSTATEDHAINWLFSPASTRLAVSSSPRPWIDVFALLEKFNMAVTESDPDPKVQKMSITYIFYSFSTRIDFWRHTYICRDYCSRIVLSGAVDFCIRYTQKNQRFLTWQWLRAISTPRSEKCP